MSFYLVKRADEKQCKVGERCMVLADFPGVPVGTKGIIAEIYSDGVMVAWIGVNKKTESDIVDAMRHPNEMQLSAGRGFLIDGFARDELGYLVFETLKHPHVDSEVTRV